MSNDNLSIYVFLGSCIVLGIIIITIKKEDTYDAETEDEDEYLEMVKCLAELDKKSRYTKHPNPEKFESILDDLLEQLAKKE